MLEISPETAEFLLALLKGTTLQVGAPDYRDVRAKVDKALDELTTAALPSKQR